MCLHVFATLRTSSDILFYSCWITDDSFFYSLNLVYFTLIFIFNSGILMAVGSSICKMKHVLKSNSKLRVNRKFEGVKQKFSASCKSGLTLFGLTCLMGTTWGLVFLGSGYVNYPILYLFCILNSLQGVGCAFWCFDWTSPLRLRHFYFFIESFMFHQFTMCIFCPRFFHLPVDLSLSKQAEEETTGGETVFNSSGHFRHQNWIDPLFYCTSEQSSTRQATIHSLTLT